MNACQNKLRTLKEENERLECLEDVRSVEVPERRLKTKQINSISKYVEQVKIRMEKPCNALHAITAEHQRLNINVKHQLGEPSQAPRRSCGHCYTRQLPGIPGKLIS